MAPHPIADGLVMLPGLVNIYLLDGPDGCVMIDTGFPQSVRRILAGIAAAGKRPEDIRHILLTHAHPDHIGGAAILKRATGAAVHAHPIDTPIVETGGPFRPANTAPGLRNHIFKALVLRWIKRVEPTVVDRPLEPGRLSFDDEMEVIHAPGHCAGQVALLWHRAGDVLFTADACVNMRGMQIPAAVEDFELAKQTMAKLAASTFEIACFGHGPPIIGGADAVFRKRWLTE